MANTPTADDRAREGATPVTDHLHEQSWSALLEHPEHADDRELVVDQAIDAIERTASGYHVNLVTYEAHGHPSEYLYDELAAAFDTAELEWEHVDQCGCGGHVVRDHVQ
ncbi:CGCGG family rSAM-modified RiPP protein [Natrialba sp. SSL1]|uniref:CGCGG family putative rSAM-modified RiPP protein n=1 Tax=Natrialba sp. SSL1 TaxID=1869245 RepID=UPI0008F852AA|nr:CGCGG family rSAM-modified RiPP protein [Natrialba sp. SSL1]OIB58978.1 hypothetical protein BBD46_05590 [Natrialba sp. SSL1]